MCMFVCSYIADIATHMHRQTYTYTKTIYTHMYTYTYMCMCICMCVYVHFIFVYMRFMEMSPSVISQRGGWWQKLMDRRRSSGPAPVCSMKRWILRNVKQIDWRN